MKIKAKTAFHLGGRPVKQNEELDLPEATAKSLVAGGLATEDSLKPPKKTTKKKAAE